VRQALVTGGSGGIGGAICRRLAADGCHVLIHAHHGLQAAQTLADAIRANGGNAQVLTFDVTDAQAVAAALTPVLDQQPIQIVVNNAGVHDDAVFPAMRAEQWQRVIDISLNGFFNVTQPLMMPMIRSRWGRVINVSSVSALMGNPGQVNYAAAKGALNAATKSLAREVASRGITVNAVAPGIIDTAMSATTFDAETIQRMVPMKRAGTPEEVAELIGFLASDKAAYITGQIISINGGLV
jgi:3-oxoacyl-[acyl-carrier protein] reductase